MLFSRTRSTPGDMAEHLITPRLANTGKSECFSYFDYLKVRPWLLHCDTTKNSFQIIANGVTQDSCNIVVTRDVPFMVTPDGFCHMLTRVRSQLLPFCRGDRAHLQHSNVELTRQNLAI